MRPDSERRNGPAWVPATESSWTRRGFVFVVVTIVCALGVAIPASATPLDTKRAQAARIADEVAALDHEYDDLQERFRGAQIRFDDLNGRVANLNTDLERTQRNLTVAENRLVERVITIYQSGASNSRLVNLATAGSVSAFIDRMETIERVSGQDAKILGDIKRLRARMEHKRAQLKVARAEQKSIVAERKAAAAEMGKKLSKRKAVLNSVNAEVRTMVAKEQARRQAAEAAAAAASRVAAEHAAATTPAAGPDPATALNPGPPPPPPGSGASGAVGAAASQVGVKYTWGGASPSTGFDCSGLVMWAYAQVGISLPHSSYALYGAGPHVSRDQLAPGDLVFFNGLGHVGIYAGGGSFIHAPHTGSFVKYDSLSGYYDSNYVGAVRIS